MEKSTCLPPYKNSKPTKRTRPRKSSNTTRTRARLQITSRKSWSVSSHSTSLWVFSERIPRILGLAPATPKLTLLLRLSEALSSGNKRSPSSQMLRDSLISNSLMNPRRTWARATTRQSRVSARIRQNVRFKLLLVPARGRQQASVEAAALQGLK